MKNMFKIISVSIGLVFCSGLTALAGPYEDAEAAYKSGDRAKALEFARKGVAAKDAKSQHMLGFMYAHGQGGVEKSIPMAMFWYQKSGNQGHAPAQHDLGYLYEAGYEDSLKPSDVDAAFWYAKAAVQGHANAQFALGKMYERGRAVTQSTESALYWYEKAAAQGQVGAKSRVPILMARLSVPQLAPVTPQMSPTKTYPIKPKISASQKAKIRARGQAYRNAISAYAGKQYVSAAAEFRKSADLGSAAAQHRLGLMYEHGIGVERSTRTAKYWYKKAADGGYVKAIVQLAELTVSSPVERPLTKSPAHTSSQISTGGIKLPVTELRALHEQAKALYKRKKYVEARKAWRKAGDGGLPASWSLVGLMYSKGEGVPQDETQAVYWYRKAAVSGVASAQLQLGTAYHNGEGIGKSYAQAIVWYTKSAEQGNSDAQFALSKCYINGHGVEVSETQALYWLKKSARSGNATAISLLKKNGIPL